MRLSSSSLVMARARTSCSERSAKRFTKATLFRTTKNNEPRLTMRKEIGAPEGAPCDDRLGREACRPRYLAVRNRGQRGRNIGVAEVYGRAPMESPLAVEEIDEKGKHGGHRIVLLLHCTK